MFSNSKTGYWPSEIFILFILITAVALLIFAMVMSIFTHNIVDNIANDTQKQLRELTIGKQVIVINYINNHVEPCLETTAYEQTKEQSWRFVAFTNKDDPRYNALSEDVINTCLRSFIISAATLEEMQQRHELLQSAGGSPYSDQEVASLLVTLSP